MVLGGGGGVVVFFFLLKRISKHHPSKGNAESLASLEEAVLSARAQLTTSVSFCAYFLQTRHTSS